MPRKKTTKKRSRKHDRTLIIAQAGINIENITQDLKKDAVVRIRVPVEVKEEMKEAAQYCRLNISAYLRRIHEQAYRSLKDAKRIPK